MYIFVLIYIILLICNYFYKQLFFYFSFLHLNTVFVALKYSFKHIWKTSDG